MSVSKSNAAGKAIIREIRLYLIDFPFYIISLKNNIGGGKNNFGVELSCYKCDKEFSFLLYFDNDLSPFVAGMRIIQLYYEGHWRHYIE